MPKSKAATAGPPVTKTALVEQCEALLFKEADGAALTVDEIGQLFSIWDRDQLQRERARVRSIRRWQVEAGSAAEREKAERAAASAESKLAKERGPILRQVEELQRQLADLECTAAAKRSEADRRQKAVEALRDVRVLPEHVLQVMAEARNDARRRYLPIVSGYDHRAQLIASLQDAMRGDPERLRAVCGGMNAPYELRRRTEQLGARFDPQQVMGLCNRWLQDMQTQQKTEKAEADRARQALAERIQEAGQLADRYLPA